MTDRHQVELRRWIQQASATSQPIELDDILDRAPIETDIVSPADVADSEIPLIQDLVQERPMPSRRNAAILIMAVAVIAIFAFALASSDDGAQDGDDVAAEQEVPTATAPPQPASEVATAFWEALATSDWETALGLVDPAKSESRTRTFGRAQTLIGQLDWYEAVGFEWQLIECVDTVKSTSACTVTARNSWSEALDVDPIRSVFVVRVGEDGITDVTDQFQEFASQWTPLVFQDFVQWVNENQPDDGAIMFDFDMDVNPEILNLYEVNTIRFVEAQQRG